MSEKVNHITNYICNICNKQYSSQSSLCNHNKKFHKKNVSNNIPVNNIPVNNTIPIVNNNVLNVPNNIINKNTCKFCYKIYSTSQNRWKHEQKCKIKKENNNKIEQLEEKNKILEETIKDLNINKIDKLEEKNKVFKKTIKKLKTQPYINNQLMNLIVDKTKTIDELKTKIDENKPNNNSLIEIINNIQIKYQPLKLNDVIVISRTEDNYINAIQLCQAGDKLFADWFRLNTTKQLLSEAEIEMGIPILQLIDIKKENSNEFQQEIWIQPDLAIQLAQWVSPLFALQVSKWIRKLFINDIQLLEDKNKEIKIKDTKIKLLQDLYIKKQQRIDYPEGNVIYILTTEDNKKKRIYIVGKASKLKNRLSNYNKTAEHEVVYYKSCKSEEDMNVIELMVINKLKEYKEKANRDRFILPIEKDITFFTDIIDKSIEFYL
jgi:hypothetical protein